MKNDELNDDNCNVCVTLFAGNELNWSVLLVGWFYDISFLDGLSNAKVRAFLLLRVIIWFHLYKNYVPSINNWRKVVPLASWIMYWTIDIIVSNFELKSLYYFPFRTYTLEKGMNPLIPTAVG